MTRIYGCSDDLIEFNGDVSGEVGYYCPDDEDRDGCLIVCSDGTVLAMKYGKPGGRAIWAIECVRKGALFDRIDICTSEDADPYSDQAFFQAGLLWAYAAKRWERVS